MSMSSRSSPTLGDRMQGALRLNRATYEEVRLDRGATAQALLVVTLAAIADGFGATGDEGGRGLIGGILGGIAAWVGFAVIAYLVGTLLFGSSTGFVTIGGLLRTLGFAQTPLLLAVFGIIPCLGGLIASTGFIWFLIAAVVAIRQGLRVTTTEALIAGTLSLIAYGLIRLIVALILGLSSLFGLG